MELLKLDILGISSSKPTKDTYVLVLGEASRKVRIPIIIGQTEAQAIALELEQIHTPRPLTHDLFKLVADRLDFSITEVVIYRFEEGVFHSRLTIERDGETFHVDSRTSDAVALAVRFNCPIYMPAALVQLTGISFPGEQESAPEETERSMTEEELAAEERKMEFVFDSDEELNEKLAKAIEAEDYERASVIRDELRSRGNGPGNR